MRVSTWIFVGTIALGCGGESAPAVGNVGLGGTSGLGGTAGAGGSLGEGGGGAGGMPAIVPSPGLWNFSYVEDTERFCFFVSADSTRLEAVGSPCGPDLAFESAGNVESCEFTVSTAEDIPIVNNGFVVQGQVGDWAECTFADPTRAFCEVHDAGGCTRSVSLSP